MKNHFLQNSAKGNKKKKRHILFVTRKISNTNNKGMLQSFTHLNFCPYNSAVVRSPFEWILFVFLCVCTKNFSWKGKFKENMQKKATEKKMWNFLLFFLKFRFYFLKNCWWLNLKKKKNSEMKRSGRNRKQEKRKNGKGSK